MTTYEDTLAYLFGLEVVRGWDLGLGRIRTVLARRGNPERRFASVHVAGTNGKGSTAAIIERVLRAAGRRTGLFTSPHLVDFTERMRAGGGTIPPARVVALAQALRADIDAAGIPLTHFEFVTVLAFEWFAEIGVEIAVVEVGLGGRLDATNVIEPVVTVITSIALDHEAFLGTTVDAIAREKAGIAKAGVPLVLGDELPAAADAAIVAVAAAVGAPVVRCGQLSVAPTAWVFAGPNDVQWHGRTIGLRGSFQERNAATALTTLAVLPTAWRCAPSAVGDGVAATEWPGRLTTVRTAPLVLLDGAHNPAGAATLAAELPALLGDRRAVLVFAVMADKAWDEIVRWLLPFARQVIVTQVGRRGLAPTVIADALRPAVDVTVVPAPRTAVTAALAAAGPDGAVVVAGSLFLVGEAYAALFGTTARLFPEWHGWDGFGTGAPA